MKTFRKPCVARARRERGMALLISLVVLVVVTILGLVSMRVALFQNRISINNQLDNTAFQAAETGISAVRAYAAAQSAGPDGILGTADDMAVTDATHLFNQAISDPQHPRRVCITAAGTRVDSTEGVRQPDGQLGFRTPCDPLPGNVARVTTVVSQAPNSSGLVNGFDVSAAAPLTVQIRAQGDVPNTNVASIHAEEWSRVGPGAGVN